MSVGKHIDAVKSGIQGTGSFSGGTQATNSSAGTPIGNAPYPANTMVYPNPVDSGLYLCPIWIHHNGYVRGYYKGLWAPVQSNPLNHDDTFSGSGAMAGKSFVVQGLQANNPQNNNGSSGDFVGNF